MHNRQPWAKFPGGSLRFLPYFSICFSDKEKIKYLENIKRLTPTERVREKEQNELMHC